MAWLGSSPVAVGSTLVVFTATTADADLGPSGGKMDFLGDWRVGYDAAIACMVIANIFMACTAVGDLMGCAVARSEQLQRRNIKATMDIG